MNVWKIRADLYRTRLGDAKGDSVEKYAARIQQLVDDYDLVADKDDGKMSKSEHTYYLICGLPATKDWEIFAQMHLDKSGEDNFMAKPDVLVTEMLAHEAKLEYTRHDRQSRVENFRWPVDRVCEPRPHVAIKDTVAYLNDLLQTEKDPENLRNIEAARNAVLAGTEIGHGEVFSDGRIVKIAEWNPSMGKIFTPNTYSMKKFTIYQCLPGIYRRHKVYFELALLPRIGIPGLSLGVCALHDTGSDAITVYERDLRFLDPLNLYPRGPPAVFGTANGDVYRDTAIVMIRLLNAERTEPVGEWFNEFASIMPDTAQLDLGGNLQIDNQGMVMFEDERLTGSEYRGQFFIGTGIVDRRLVLSTDKTGMVTKIPASWKWK